MKILFLSHSPNDPNGGASRVYHMLTDALRRRGHTVDLFHYEDFNPPRGKVPERLTQRFALPQLISRRASALALSTYDVIMSSSGMASPLFARLRTQSDRPALVNHLHGLAVFDHIANVTEAELGHLRLSWTYRNVTGPMQVRWDTAGVYTADLTVVQNLRDLSTVEAILGDRPSAVTIPLAVHPDLLAASDTCTAPAARSAATLLWFASWGARKGAFYLPAAFRRVRERRGDATLIVGGTNRSEGDVRREFDARDREAVVVVPKVSITEQIALLNRSAVFLFPSLSEGFGLALLEAMCFGVAAVTSNTGLGGDFLTDGVDARVVPTSSEHIARAVADLLDDDSRRCEIAERGRALARTFTLDRMATAYENALLATIARVRSRTPTPASVPRR